MQDFFSAYVEAALWSTTDDNDVPLDSNYVPSDIAKETFERMRADCERFQKENEESLQPEFCDSRYGLDAQAGHDFWLTREGHGCGFWDGDWKEPAAEKLTEASRKFGSFDLYVGDDGLIYGN